MQNEASLLTFLANSRVRVGRLLKTSAKMRNMKKFQELQVDLESKFPGSKVYFYGTRIMQLGHERSHLNIFIDVDNSYFKSQSIEKVDEMMETLWKYFESEVELGGAIWDGPISDLKTPVPAIRIHHVVSRRNNLQCDITFDSGIGVENTKLVHHMFSLQPEAFKLYHFVRIWIHIDEFSFKRYMVAQLVIFYLQQKKLLPSVVEMQEDVPETFIKGWNVEFNRQKKIEDYGMEKLVDYEEHFAAFFEFYGEFEFKENVICPYLGRAVPTKNYPEKDVDLMKFKDNIKGFNKQDVNVADMFNLNFNCAYGVGKKRAKKFKVFCKYAVELLREFSAV